MSSDRDDMAHWLAQNQIREVECLIADVSGTARGKFVPVDQFLGQSDARLPEAVLLQTITGEYSDTHWDFVEPTDADMMLLPDPSTLRLVPWATKPTAQIIHNCYTMDGEPHPLSTRNITPGSCARNGVLPGRQKYEFCRCITGAYWTLGAR